MPQSLTLPPLGHLLMVFPLADTAVSCAGITLDANRYMLLAPTDASQPIDIRMLETFDLAGRPPRCLVLWLSPAFVGDMAGFLDIPNNLQQLLHRVPLLRGDQISLVLAELANVCRHSTMPATIEGYFMEVVGEVMRLMRLRHQALLRLAQHKDSTTADLLSRLLQARQFIEASYTERFKTRDVADYVALSEFHFARLFKTAFDITVRQYVIRLRLDKARHLLEQPQSTVTGVALEAGYGSLSSFIHAFTERFGASPAQYRARIAA